MQTGFWRVAAITALFWPAGTDARAEDSADLRIDTPYVFASLHRHATPWQLDSGMARPKHRLQWSIYHQPRTKRRADSFGMLAV